MKLNTMNFAAKTLSLALFFAVFLFSGQLSAANGCHADGGCDNTMSGLYKNTPFSNPTYSPSWTEISTTGRVRGGQYIKFSVVEGEVYQWSTEGAEDAFGGTYAKQCTEDTWYADCHTPSDNDAQGFGLRCLGGYCLLPFDTELTLLKGENCSAESEFLAYSNSGGFRNQSQLEWKATFTGTVVLLVTNNKFVKNTSASGEVEEYYDDCQKTTGTATVNNQMTNMTTTVKWRRASSEHCATCDNLAGENIYKFNSTPFSGADSAPAWTTIQTKDAVDLLDFMLSPSEGEPSANDAWAKPGSYFVFEVVESQIYRWSTCIADFQDTQLTLFKGDKTDATDTCGDFLAYGDDSKVSYIYEGQTYCPAGTKQTVLEWQANFSGKVTLLMNEYNCSQCYPQEIPLPGGQVQRNWINCFVEVDGMIYPFPLDWQRYDCDTCSTLVTDITDNSSSFDGSLELNNGQYVKFTLKRGSKYLFKASSPSDIITIRKGDCDGELLAQGTGQLTYFATSDYSMAAGEYPADVVAVFVSESDCRPLSEPVTLIYSYYSSVSGANIKDRFQVTEFGSSQRIVYDSTTSSEFVDTGEWAWTWQGALEKCRVDTKIGSDDDENVVQCPDPVCPSGKYNNNDPRNTQYFCKYQSSGEIDGQCKLPACANNYAEYKKTEANKNDEDKQDLFGKCYYNLSGSSNCNVANRVKTDTEDPYNCKKATKISLTKYQCEEGYEWASTLSINGTGEHCCQCPDGYVMERSGTKFKCNKYEDICSTSQKCIDNGTLCSYLSTVTVCPEGYTEQSDGTCLSDTEEPYNVFGSSPDSEYYNQLDSALSKIELETCPDGTSPVNGFCQYDNCGQWIYYQKVNTYWGSKLVTTDVYPPFDGSDGYEAEYPLCNQVKNKDAEKFPCCCEVSTYKTSASNFSATTLWYAKTFNPNNSVSSAEAWSCQAIDESCPSGYTKGDDGDCYKCSEGMLLKRNGEYGCYECPSGYESVEGLGCFKCEAGYAPKAEGEGGGIICKKECPEDGYQQWEESQLKCYTNVSEKIQKCDTENGWIEDPNQAGRCRKIQTSSTGDVYVKCAQGALKPNLTGRECDEDAPNSYDCDCNYDSCEATERLQDRKVCPNPYVVDGHPYAIDGDNVITTEYNGMTVVKGCRYTDSSGQTCGEAIGGWTLPNINQLYSIIDFDLYDPATAYPFDSSYNRLDGPASCTPHPHNADPENNPDNTCSAAEDCGDTAIYSCQSGHCVSNDPFGDNQCGAAGRWICIDNHCVRNNWYWSSTTVVSENADNGQFVWAVNMEDGRSYYAVKGCTGDDCNVNIDLSARPHHVLCIKGSSLAGIFDADAPSAEQAFSGWACDKNDTETSLHIYFEILDSKDKDVVDLLGTSNECDDSPDAVNCTATIPGSFHKAIKYGSTDIIPDSGSNKYTEIYNNCGFGNANNHPHAFGIKWQEDAPTPGREALAALILELKEYECSPSRLADDGDAKTDCGVPPYFVTAYGVNQLQNASAIEIAPTRRPFVFKNVCGDGYKTFDGTYTENCESEDLGGSCGYGETGCQLCDKEDKTVGGTLYKACTKYPATPPSCMDGTLQSQYCTDEGVIANGHTGAGLSCEFHDFASNNIVSLSEECDCPVDSFYYYQDADAFNCSQPLNAKVCPNYYTTASAAAGEDNFCYICSGCKREKVLRPRCGDGTVHRTNCSGYDKCEVVSGVNEECDDGNSSDTDTCTNDCKEAKCGDGHIQPGLGEICDSGTKNGYYATNCDGTEACPGCASITCGKDDTDPFGPRCGDGVVQHKNKCDDPSFISTYGPVYGFNNKTECEAHMHGAEELCDNGASNGMAIPFDDFLATPEGADCAGVVESGTDSYPVNAIHAKYLECVYKYKQYIDSHSGCSKDCKTPTAPYCGDGKKDPGESCDEGLPNVTISGGNYSIPYGQDNGQYNGGGKDHCRLDCKAVYECSDDIIEKECPLKTPAGFCEEIGVYDETGKLNLYVKNAGEKCDDGSLNGIYGHCDKSCAKRAFCGSGGGSDPALMNCIEMDGASCIRREECDFGQIGDTTNTSVELGYSAEYQGSCVAEEGCDTLDASQWNGRICCQFGRYCGDGTVDNGSKVASGIDWKNPENWNLSGANVTYDARNLSLRFELTAATATAELSEAIPVDSNLRYFLEYNMMAITTDSEVFDFKAGANEYDETDNKITNASYDNASPFFFSNPNFGAEGFGYSEDWYHGKNAIPIRGENNGSANSWISGTKKVRILFKMTGVSGTEFLLRAVSFYDIDHAHYGEAADSSEEMCDPGTENFKTSSNYYMTDCAAGCKWINYCGDSIVQRSTSCESDGTFNGYQCVSNITYAEEICDNGSNETNVYNGCEPGCLELGPRCGDGFTDQKACPSGSESWCNTPTGLSKAEQCDLGDALNSNEPVNSWVTSTSNYGTCRENCTYSRCGDGILDTVKRDDGTLEGEIVEECDCGTDKNSYYELTKNQSTTVNGQTVYLCMKDNGDPLYNTISEQKAALCRPNCKISRCGDGILDIASNEECDDGNFSDHDSCTSECKLNRVGDGIFAHSRSYLCEELIGLSANEMAKMAAKGVADCGGTNPMSCADMAAALTTKEAVKTYFEEGRLHCCYNQKLGGFSDDHNCELEQSGVWYTPKKLAIKRCVQFAKNVTGPSSSQVITDMSEEQCTTLEKEGGEFAAIERCEKCTNETCDRICQSGDVKCLNQRQLNCTTKYTTQTDIDACIVKNTYCNASGWNIIGSCGDGKVDDGAGEACDNNVAEENRKYEDLNGAFIPGGSGWGETYNDGSWYKGQYCTGECKGSCNEESPVCGGSVTNNCWQEGCTRKIHKPGVASTTVSKCGDGFLDTYAGEECDNSYQNHTDSWYDSYCSTKCKFNRKGSASGAIAKCGDGEIQEKDETCDDGNTNNDDYCVADAAGVGCQVYYGSCGDGKITGPGYALDNKWTPGNGGGTAGPEDCDTQDERTQSFFSANTGLAMSKLCNATTCKRVGTCGDGTRDYRFEGCDNGSGNNTSNITKDGVTCFKGCKSNPKGGLIKASNSEISGWACDPDHPMTHPTTLVRIKITDANGTTVGEKTLATTKDVEGTDYFDFTATTPKIVKECGGGKQHGWTYDPSASDTAMNWISKVPPFKVEAYVASLDGAPETEQFIGEKTFVRNMICGDAYVSTCASIEVTTVTKTPNVSWSAGRVCSNGEVEGECTDYGLVNGEACADNDERTCASIKVTTITRTASPWANNKICKDEDVENGCAYYGLENNKACKDEACDKGNNNGDDKDCDSKCQWTSCGDNTVQANATGIRPDGTSYEECEGTIASKECTTLLSDKKEDDTDLISGDATCSGTADPKCKWNRKICSIQSNCPALKTGIKTNWTNAGSGYYYDSNNADRYIKYKGSGKYNRNWTGTKWGEKRETEVKYDTVAVTQPEKDCSFVCQNDFTWDGTRCKPRTDITLTCTSCPSQASNGHGVWSDGTGSCTSVTKKLTQTITLNSDGTVSKSPTSAVTQYNTSNSSTTCNWKCDSSSQWSGTKCLANTQTFTCTGKPAGTKWIPVTKDGSGNIVYGTPADSMTITQVLTNPSAGTYSPTNAQLVAIDMNSEDYGPKNNKEILGSTPQRCYYGCSSGWYYDAGTGTCKQSSCGDSVVNHATCEGVSGTCYVTIGADELCDVGTNNGKYAGSGATQSNCDKYCGSYTKCKADHPSDYSTACAFIKASGYNGRIGGGSKFFCGDGKKQYKSGTSCTGTDCEEAKEGNYPGANISSLSATELCDPNGASDQQTLCTMALGNHTYYKYNSSASLPSCNGCTAISNATATTGCNYCGDGTRSTAINPSTNAVYEACEPGESSATICSRESGTYYGQNTTYNWSFESTSFPSWISASVSSWGLNSTYKYSGSYSYCSNNTGSASSSATMTLNVTAQATGTVSFYIQGTSEKNYDYLTITQAGSQVFNSKGTDYGSWTKLSFSVSKGTTAFVFTYSKDGSVDTGMDRYCVDYLEAPSVDVPYSTRSTNPSNKTCNSDCTLGSGVCYNGWCGDSTTNGPEACDQGSSNSNSWSLSKHCNSNCTGWAPHCGDGAVNGSEACEPGQTKTEKGGECDSSWTSTYYYKTPYTCNSSCQWVAGTTYCDN